MTSTATTVHSSVDAPKVAATITAAKPPMIGPSTGMKLVTPAMTAKANAEGSPKREGEPFSEPVFFSAEIGHRAD